MICCAEGRDRVATVPNGRNNRRRCLVCGKHRNEVGNISWAGNCRNCGHERLLENIDGIATHSGPAFMRWRYSIAASVGAVPLDVLQDGS
jgi:hypothetical protein